MGARSRKEVVMEVVSVWDPKYKPQGPQRQERMAGREQETA